jgi:hypothetical protein
MGFEFKPNLETKDIFKNEKEWFLKGFNRVLVLNMNLIRKRTLSTHITNLKQYIITKINTGGMNATSIYIEPKLI